MEKKLILWIHGFAGCPDNANVKEMRKLYPEHEWYSIEVDHHAKASMEKINEYIRSHEVSLVAGTSLGGYYAMCAEFKGPKLVVNPVTNPVHDLRQFLGLNAYKTGRPDGQQDFIFTEEMLMEYSEIHLHDLHNVVCHHTAHDQVLGEDIKKDYQEMFYYLEEIDAQTLPSHFMTYRYVKYMRKVLHQLLVCEAVRERNPYDHYGYAYQYLPEYLVPTLLASSSMLNCVNWKKLLLEVEACIKEEYKNKNKNRLYLDPYSNDEKRTREMYRILFVARKHILRRMFTHTQESFDVFKQINLHLEDLYNKMVDKMARLYSFWLENEDDDWCNDCNVSGKIVTEATKEDYPDDETGSDYEWMMERIEDIEGNILTSKGFSGSADKPCNINDLSLTHDYANRKYSGGGQAPFGDFLMCHPFQQLHYESLYAPQDILRIKYYWCDVALTHQRIINNKGELQ